MRRACLTVVLFVLIACSLVSQTNIATSWIREPENSGYGFKSLTADDEISRGPICDEKTTNVGNRLMTGSVGLPTTGFSKYFGGADRDDAWSVAQTADGGYLVVGDTISYGSGFFDYWVVKVGATGNMEWNRTYGGSKADRARSVARTFDGGYVIAGFTSSYGSGIDDFWVVKVNASGSKQRDWVWGGPNYDRAYSVVQSSDGRYIIVGYTMSYGAGNEDACMVIMGENGISHRTYGGPNTDIARCVIQTCDGGFAIAGYTNSYGSGSYDFWLIKTDGDGNMEWQKYYGNTGSDMAWSLKQTSSGGYILVGDTDYFTHGSYDIWLVKTDCQGNELWPVRRIFGGSGSDSASSVIETCDGGYLVVGETASKGAGLDDVWVIKTDCDGNYPPEWDQTYGGSGSDIGYYVQQTSDGGFILAGSTASFGAGLDDFYLVKLTSQWSMNDLRILPRLQLKDTRMLCLDGCSLSGVHAWDVHHGAQNWEQCPHDNMSCVRASISMINSYYGGILSQDRISYHYFEELHHDGKYGPEGDLGHGYGMPVDEALGWALNGAVGNHRSEKPDFSLVKQWIDAGRPILRLTHAGVGHATVIDGYEDTGQKVHVLDPWDGTEKSLSYSDLTVNEVWWIPAGATARSDEDWNNNGVPDTMEDCDHDGVCDFDEIYRFFTSRDARDTDGDGVPDRAEIVGYTFLNDGSFDALDVNRPNPDGDFDGQGRPLRAERDYDSDNGGVWDGLEDKNGNGFVDPGETNPLDASDDPNAVHFEAKQDNGASLNLGTIKLDGTPHSLPNDTTKPAKTYPIEYNAASGYVFDHWETRGSIRITDSYADPTYFSVSGSGTLVAVYKAIMVHVVSPIVIQSSLGRSAESTSDKNVNKPFQQHEIHFSLVLACCAWILSGLKERVARRKRFILLSAVSIVALLMGAVAYSIMTSNTINSSGTIAPKAKLNIYWDSQCSNKASLIDWGLVSAGASKNVTLYLRNEGNFPLNLSMGTSDWDPSDTINYAILKWDKDGEVLQQNRIADAIFTLGISSNMKNIGNFSFNVTITAQVQA